jgi:signal transduction histidine kinase
MTDQLAANIEELKDGMRRQEEFMGSFAHELKTPMTAIIGYADLLRGRQLTPEEKQEASNYIFSEGKRLESLSLKLLNLLVLKKRDFELVRCRPKHILQEVIRGILPVLKKDGIALEYAAEDGVCLLEPDLVKSLLFNVIDNARKAIDGGGVIGVRIAMKADGCLVQVADSGRGMAEEELKKITEAFYRVDKSRSRAQGGVGLGLAICNEIVQLHNGDMQFTSILERGTCVTIRLRGGGAGV